MTEALLFLIASLSVFIILTEIVTVRLLYDGQLSVQIHFTILAVYLSQGTKRKSSWHASKKQKNRSRRLGAYARSVIPSSEISVSKIELYIPKDDPAKTVLKRAYASAVISSLLAYADATAKNFHCEDITLLTSDNTNLKTTVDLSITVSLLRLITASAVLFKKHGD